MAAIRDTPRAGQFGLFPNEVDEPSAASSPVSRPPLFHTPTRTDLRVGVMPLADYLRERAQRFAFDLVLLLGDLDEQAFASHYSGGGRPAYSPVLMLGLILYGLAKGVSSTRKLEELSQLDLGAMYVCAGIQPDHSTLSRFILRHAEDFDKALFEPLLQGIYRHMQLSVDGALASDGTVIEAFASSRRKLSADAARELANEARQASDEEGQREDLSQRAAEAEALAEVAEQREAARVKKGRKDKGRPVVVPTDPEATLQRAKKGGASVAAYTASATADEHRLVSGWAVESCGETAVAPDMLAQSERLRGIACLLWLLDAGYFCVSLLKLSLERGITLLCSAGRHDHEARRRRPGTKYLKEEFSYDERRDVYVCPAGEILEREGARGRYRGRSCSECSQRSKCTKAKGGRTVTRNEGDVLREVQREVMKDPRAKRAYRQRSAIIEPVFSELRGVQNLNRFRRRGLKKVRVEFCLHVTAHNVRRFSQLARRRAEALRRLVFFCFWGLWGLLGAVRRSPSRSGSDSAQTRSSLTALA